MRDVKKERRAAQLAWRVGSLVPKPNGLHGRRRKSASTSCPTQSVIMKDSMKRRNSFSADFQKWETASCVQRGGEGAQAGVCLPRALGMWEASAAPPAAAQVESLACAAQVESPAPALRTLLWIELLLSGDPAASVHRLHRASSRPVVPKVGWPGVSQSWGCSLATEGEQSPLLCPSATEEPPLLLPRAGAVCSQISASPPSAAQFLKIDFSLKVAPSHME